MTSLISIHLSRLIGGQKDTLNMYLIWFSSLSHVKKPESGILSDWSYPVWQAFEREGKGGFGYKRNASGTRRRREGNACQEAIVFAIPPTNYVTMQKKCNCDALIFSPISCTSCFSFVFLKQGIWSEDTINKKRFNCSSNWRKKVAVMHAWLLVI